MISKEGRLISEGLPCMMADYKGKEIIMLISENLSRVLMQYKREYGLSFEDLAQKLGLPKSSTVNYCNGTGNPRSDTLEAMSAALDIPLTEIVSAPLPGQEQAETVTRAAQIISGLEPERQKRALQIFLELAALFAEGSQN